MDLLKNKLNPYLATFVLQSQKPMTKWEKYLQPLLLINDKAPYYVKRKHTNIQ